MTATVDTRKIRFIKNRPWLSLASASKPGPVIKTIPDWYKNADRFAQNPMTGKPWELPSGGGKVPTWKSCPAIYDIMGSGYVYKTPCDLEFTEDASGNIQVKVLDPKNKDFIQDRMPMPQFEHPLGYHAKHFAWWADWAVELPEGYSALYTQPFNRFELPFLTTSGIIDNDHVHLPGTMPFFIVKGFTGILPAGTPYAQILPFKRENWSSEVDVALSQEQMMLKNQENSAKYRLPDGGVYQKEVWERRKYE
jgi:hypothetical protein